MFSWYCSTVTSDSVDALTLMIGKESNGINSELKISFSNQCNHVGQPISVAQKQSGPLPKHT